MIRIGDTNMESIPLKERTLEFDHVSPHCEFHWRRELQVQKKFYNIFKEHVQNGNIQILNFLSIFSVAIIFIPWVCKILLNFYFNIIECFFFVGCIIWNSVDVVFVETFQRMFSGKYIEICIEAYSLRLCRIHRRKIQNDGIVADLFLFRIARVPAFSRSVYIYLWRANNRAIFSHAHADSCMFDHGRHGGITDTKITSTRHACKSQQILSLSLFPRAHGSWIFAQKL